MLLGCSFWLQKWIQRGRITRGHYPGGVATLRPPLLSNYDAFLEGDPFGWPRLNNYFTFHSTIMSNCTAGTGVGGYFWVRNRPSDSRPSEVTANMSSEQKPFKLRSPKFATIRGSTNSKTPLNSDLQNICDHSDHRLQINRDSLDGPNICGKQSHFSDVFLARMSSYSF